MRELAREIDRVQRELEVKGAVITGTEQSFASGAEIGELAELSPAQAFEFSRFGQGIFRAIENSAKPVIAAIRGYCMGGGLDLALACRARIAAPDAVFAHPGGALGILTGWGGTPRLPRLVGRSRALEMLILGHRLGAREALQCGLIAHIFPADKLLDAAVEIAEA
jgi:enoyl-CoA hydratase